MKKNKLKLEFFIIPIIIFFLVMGIIFFEIIKRVNEPRIKIEIRNLTNEEKENLREGYEVLFQIKLLKKELSDLERKYKKKNLSFEEIEILKEKINQFEKDIIDAENIPQLKKISQDFWDSRIWEEIFNLEKGK
ncbi:MAG: hypothetical protein ACK413_00325 [Patescibacteria group bacterium]